jgi:hypothetical protein
VEGRQGGGGPHVVVDVVAGDVRVGVLEVAPRVKEDAPAAEGGLDNFDGNGHGSDGGLRLRLIGAEGGGEDGHGDCRNRAAAAGWAFHAEGEPHPPRPGPNDGARLDVDLKELTAEGFKS